VSTPVALDDDTIVMFTLIVVNDVNLLLLEAAGTGVEVLERTSVEVCTTPAVLDDANPVVLSPAVLALVLTDVDDDVPSLETADADDDMEVLVGTLDVLDDGNAAVLVAVLGAAKAEVTGTPEELDEASGTPVVLVDCIAAMLVANDDVIPIETVCASVAVMTATNEEVLVTPAVFEDITIWMNSSELNDEFCGFCSVG